MDDVELKAGKDRVQALLFDRLNEMGMARRRGTTLEALGKMQARLCNLLAYMDADRLVALAEVIERHAAGVLRNGWPEEVTIKNWARALQQPPASDSKLVRSYIGSVGARAYERGTLAELYQYLKQNGRPPSDQGWVVIGQNAQKNQARRAREIERGDPDGLAWVGRYDAALTRARRLLPAKEVGA